MLGLAKEAGHELTQDASAADVLVVNPCAFIDSAKQESIDTILEMAQHKTNGSCKKLVVTGCLAERYRDELKKEIPEIDAVLGTGEVPQIVSAIGTGVAPLNFFRGESRILNPESRPTYIYDADTPRFLATPKHYAYVKIAEGCDYKCAFCIIPKLRGAYRSRPAESIVREARALAARGVKELLLVSQDTTFYGIDRGERGALARLLRKLNAVDGLEWIRLLYLYPTTIDDDVLHVMAEHPRVCKYIDLPLQHASPAVLKRMKRPGTGESYRRLLARIRDRVPGVSLRTTLIVGVPGETDAEFEELRQFVREVEFDHLGVFTYSHEEGTTAFELEDDVPADVKTERHGELMGLQQQIVRERNQARIGGRVRVVVDGPSSEHELVVQGRTEGQAPDIDSVVYLSDCDSTGFPPGSFVEAEIVAANGYDLVVRPVDGGP